MGHRINWRELQEQNKTNLNEANRDYLVFRECDKPLVEVILIRIFSSSTKMKVVSFLFFGICPDVLANSSKTKFKFSNNTM